MIPHITRGSSMKGLMEYLAGPGKANEHTSPHLVAGDGPVMAWNDDAVLDMAAARGIAAHLDLARRQMEVEVPRGSVWHASLSVRADEGILDEAKWADIARDFVDGMGFSGSSGKAACRWVAVHHGQSKEGNDHIHIAVSLVREDGTKASVWNDFKNAQRIAGELEVKYGLEVLESRGAGRGERAVTPAEIAKTERTGAVEPERLTVARTVRGAAAASADEAEFVRRARREGLLVRPRYAAGRQDVVLGYSAALRPTAGQRPVWFGGGHLAKDLSLPRLRAEWPDTPQAASEAAAEWNAARRAQRPAAPGREAREVDPALWAQHTEEVAALREALRTVPVEDTATWAKVAHDVSGAFAAWSLRVEPVPGPLAATAEALARSATVRAYAARPGRTLPSARGASLLVSSIAHGGVGTVAQTVLLRQLGKTAKAMHDACTALGQAQRAAQIATAARTHLATVNATLPSEPAAPQSVAPAEPQPIKTPVRPSVRRESGPVLPADLVRSKRHTTSPGLGRGFER